ncbi:MAG: hydroxyisourate hydrolase [Gammaproteobacteria bacterium]|nr:hydroxyisourate hydrolase [Gammaproteobacteria bacterium]MDD9874535.1 hydroxyisourate hydrolase [Gammaproteobacteria bacterium]
MATLTTHVLDSLSGTHAAGLGVTLYRIEPAGGRTALFNAVTDAGGRLHKTVEVNAAHTGATCELVFQTADYFARQSALPGVVTAHPGILREAALRFVMPDPDGAYHIPMMLAPSSVSVWCSSSSSSSSSS